MNPLSITRTVDASVLFYPDGQFTQWVRSGLMSNMKPIEKVRRENFAKAIDDIFAGSQTAAAERLGKEKPTQINHWLGGKKNMSTPSARAIEEAFELPKFWLDSEHNSEYSDNLKTGTNAGLIEKSNPSHAPSITKKKPPAYGNFDLTTPGHREIPVISYVQAGMMTEALDPFSLGEGFETITVSVPCSEHTFALRIKGKSMLPRFEPGDVVVIDPQREPRPGLFVVAKNTEEEATFKKYKALGVNEYGDAVFELVPLNEDFATLHSERDHLHVIGVAIEHRKGLLE
jgi:SOS-response transcriptional repressor LexA